MFIYRPEYYGITEDEKGATAGMADIIIAKHRSGEVGEVRLRFIGKYARFENASFVPTSQMASGVMPQNDQFDQAGNTTILVDSRINRMEEGDTPFDMPPDDSSQF